MRSTVENIVAIGSYNSHAKSIMMMELWSACKAQSRRLLLIECLYHPCVDDIQVRLGIDVSRPKSQEQNLGLHINPRAVYSRTTTVLVEVNDGIDVLGAVCTMPGSLKGSIASIDGLKSHIILPNFEARSNWPTLQFLRVLIYVLPSSVEA